MLLKTGRFQRADRILSSRDFQYLTKFGYRRASEGFVVIITSQGDANSRSTDAKRKKLGVTVGRRVGNSVVRNRVKRHVREWFRHARAELPNGSDILVIARRAGRDLSGCEVVVALDKAVDGLRAWGVGRATGEFR